MPDIKRDKDREHRIGMEAVVDAYGSEERAMGWYYYVADNCNFPFKAKCIAERRSSPLNVNDEVVVSDAAPAEECEREMFVDIEWGDRKLSVPLSQLEGVDTDDETRQIIEDWHYWAKRGYEF
ncbi:calcium-binding protein [Desulfobacterales bacterium HSG2]|nr:calcium-binding protein [Desulfobacterales bacterium HSG2]